jgi:translocation and assembly module TamA
MKSSLVHMLLRAAVWPFVVLATALPVAFPAAPAHAATVDTRLEGVNDKDILKNIESTLSIIREKDRKGLDGAGVAELHNRAPAEIQKAVEPFGYYRAEVEGSLTPDGEKHFEARYVISLGEPVRVRSANVSVTGEGKGRPPFPDVVKAFSLKPGDVLDQRVYTRAKNAFASAAADSGYLDAQFTASTIRIHREENLADIELVFETGPLYRFGTVQFDSTAVDERVLRPYLKFKEGDPFRYSKLAAFQSALGGTPYFNRVEAVPRRDLAVDNVVPIDVKLSMQRPQRFEIGVGYGTDTGPRVLLSAEFRRLNRAGHRYTGRANVSEVELSLYASYVIPSLYPDTHEYTIAAMAARLDPVAYNTDRLAIGPTRSQPRFGWLESITLSYEHEDFSVGPDDGITSLFIAGLSYSRKRANDPISPRHGQRLDLALRGADEALLSSQSFLSFTTSAKAVRSLGERVRLLGRVDGGATSTSSFRELPPTVRFFAGGDNSVRGYEYQSLGPRGENGQVVGGELLLTSSAEVEVGLVGKFAVAGFYDAGNAFPSLGNGVMEQGVGGGLRWKSPVGPIRLDLAFPIHHNDWRVHFTMGPDL